MTSQGRGPLVNGTRFASASCKRMRNMWDDVDPVIVVPKIHDVSLPRSIVFLFIKLLVATTSRIKNAPSRETHNTRSPFIPPLSLNSKLTAVSAFMNEKKNARIKRSTRDSDNKERENHKVNDELFKCAPSRALSRFIRSLKDYYGDDILRGIYYLSLRPEYSVPFD